MATLADVAALAQVSKATASRAFTRPSAVSPRTAQRVLDAAAKLGFVPNSAARQLAGGKTGIIALVVPTLNNSYFSPIIAGAQKRAHELGTQLTISVHPLASVEELPAFERLSKQVDGFILATPRGSDDLVRTAGSFKTTILLDREVLGMSSVIADTATAFGKLAQKLIAAGHKHILYLGGPGGSWQDPRRLKAIKDAAEQANVKVSTLGPYPSTFEAGIETVKDVEKSGATAVIPYATALGIGMQFAMLSAGATKIPVVSSETSVAQALQLHDAPIIDVDGDNLGKIATEQLVSQVLNPQNTPVNLHIPVHMS